MTPGLFVVFMASAFLTGVIVQAVLNVQRDDPRGYLYTLGYLVIATIGFLWHGL